MKKKFLYLMTAAMLPMGFAACEDPTEVPDKYDPNTRSVQLSLKALQNNVVEIATYGKTSVTVNVITNQSQWKVSVEENDWCKVKRQNSSVLVEVTKNMTDEPREVSASLADTYGKHQTNFTVWQVPNDSIATANAGQTP